MKIRIQVQDQDSAPELETGGRMVWDETGEFTSVFCLSFVVAVKWKSDFRRK